MKKISFLALVALFVIPVVTIIAGCSSSGGGGGGGGPMIGAFFSFPNVYVLKTGTNQFFNYLQPFTGEAITDATVIVSNETTGYYTNCVYNSFHQYYIASAELFNGTGESVSVKVVSSAGNVTGGPTVTPNSYTFITAPLGPVSVPFTVSWLVSAESSPASHVWLKVYTFGTPEGYQIVLPVATTSYQITSAMITGKGNYYLSVYPVNTMTFTGAADGSVGYVGSARYSPTVNVTIN